LLCLPRHVECVVTLPCESKNSTFIILPLQPLKEITLKFIYFLFNVIYNI